jgi:SAM-dependent methyltransferase
MHPAKPNPSYPLPDQPGDERRKPVQLKTLPYTEYVGVNKDDPIRFYRLPVIGALYRRRVEMCLSELNGGRRILEVGFGSGVTFLNLKDIYAEIHGIDLSSDAASIQSFFQKKGVQTFLRNGSLLDLPYADDSFDAVLLISILEHLKPEQLPRAFAEIRRVLVPGGQVVYGVPVERRLMTWMFRLLGYKIHQHHFSSEKDVAQAAGQVLTPIALRKLKGVWGLSGSLYEVGHFVKASSG